jgi:hypothetical protein
MVNINTEGLEVAPLDKNQMDKLLQAEKNINGNASQGDVYLLAVTRKS